MGVYKLREVLSEGELSFMENVNDPASNTYEFKLPILDGATVTLDQPRIEDTAIYARQNDSSPGFKGPRSATLEFTVYWSGYGATQTGSVSTNWIAEHLFKGLGGLNTAQVGVALNGSPTATSLTVASGGGNYAVGSIARVGTKLDGGADGQAALVSASNATSITLATALPAAPSSGHQVWAHQIAYPTETPTSTMRFIVAWAQTGIQFHLLGCQLEGLSFDLPIGGLPKMTFRYRCAYWARAAVSTPQSGSLSTCATEPIAGGSLFYQTTGTSTRNVMNPSRIGLNINLGLGVKEGPAAGQPQYGTINGYERIMSVPEVEVQVPWDTAYETLWDSDGADTTYKTLLATLNTSDKKAVGFCLQRAYIVSPRPNVPDDYNGLNFVTLRFRGREGTTTTNDLTRASFVLFM